MIWVNWHGIEVFFSPKIVTKLVTYPGSRGYKSTGSWIRIRNTAEVSSTLSFFGSPEQNITLCLGLIIHVSLFLIKAKIKSIITVIHQLSFFFLSPQEMRWSSVTHQAYAFRRLQKLKNTSNTRTLPYITIKLICSCEGTFSSHPMARRWIKHKNIYSILYIP